MSAVIAVATLALGLGINAAIFSLTRDVLLRPLPYRDADRLVQVFEKSQPLGVDSAPTAPVNYAAWRDRVGAFEHTAFFRRVSFNAATRTTPAQVEGFRVSPGFFPLLGVEPMLGRNFTDDDARPGRDGVVMLGNGFWHRRFDGDPAIVGQTIVVDATPCVVVGVLPPSFKIFRVLNRELDVFRPFVLDATDREQSMIVWARLKRGVSLEGARAEMATAYATLPIRDHQWTADVATLASRFAAQSRSILITLQWAVGLVLLIACANIANLLLAVASGRQGELAIRQALGATPWQIARDLAGETIILAGSGCAVAIAVAAWIVAALNARVSFADVNRLEPFRVDGWVFAFTAALAVGVALVFGLLPARAAADANVVDALKDATPGATAGISTRRLRHALVIGELALAIVLTASAFALARSVLALQGFARGFNPDRVMTGQISLNDPRYADTPRLVHVATAMLERLAASPGVVSAALVNYPPVATIRVGVPVTIEGRPPPAKNQLWLARYFVVAPNFFHTAQIPIVRGRDFTVADDLVAPGVAIVSEGFARRFWNGTDVIGHRLRPEFPESDAFWIPRGARQMLTIVGVAGDVREDGLPDSEGVPQLYLPYAQSPTVVVTLLARMSGTPEAGAPAIREAARSADPQAPVSYEMSFEGVIDETFARPREMAWLIGAFAALASVLAAVGVFGVMTYLTNARGREIRIRVALGAAPVDVVALIASHAMKLTVIGAAIGIVLAPVALSLIGSLLFGVGPLNLLTLAAVTALLGAISLFASLVPAWLAARPGPITLH